MSESGQKVNNIKTVVIILFKATNLTVSASMANVDNLFYI